MGHYLAATFCFVPKNKFCVSRLRVYQLTKMYYFTVVVNRNSISLFNLYAHYYSEWVEVDFILKSSSHIQWNSPPDAFHTSAGKVQRNPA